jgi:hypothetical protein
MPSLNSYFRISSSQNAPLKVGLLLDSLEENSAWSSQVIEDIRKSNFAELKLLVVRRRKSNQQSQSKSKVRSLVRTLSEPTLRRRMLYGLYLRLDRRTKPQPDPLAQINSRELLSGIETIEVEPIGTRFIHRFPDDVVEKIRSKDLDVLIRFGFNILHGDILKAARYGVWSYHHGDNDFYRGGPAHFWELYEGSELSGVMLQVLSEDLDAGLVLCKSFFATEPGWSLSRNRFTPYWGATHLVIRKLNELHQYGWDFVKQNAVAPAPYQGRRKIYRVPNNLELGRWLAPLFLRKAISRPFRKATVRHWKIAIRVNGRPLYEDGEPDFSGFRWLDPPRGHFWADPFIVKQNGQYWAFFEDFSYETKRGSIACAQILESGELGRQFMCLEDAEHHYSYPHVFRAGQELFMVPESLDADCVSLFRCEEFPYRWRREAVLLQGKFVDTTIWEHNGFWWLMTTNAEPTSGTGALLLFYSESLRGTWHFHPSNPISTDVRRKRAGGAILRRAGRLIRTSQSCAPSYGYSIGFNEITSLSTRRYEERVVRTILPEYWSGVSGIHTYNHTGNIEMIDGRTSIALKLVQD